MKIAIIGVGTIGAAVAYTLMMTQRNLHIILCEPHKPNKKRTMGEYYDLLPVATHTRNKLEVGGGVYQYADYYLITNGIRRTSIKQSKQSLFKLNYPIVRKIMAKIPKGKRVFIASNPPNEIVNALDKEGFSNMLAMRECTDTLRELAGDPQHINNSALKGKGFTQYTPAYAIAMRIFLNEGMRE